MEAIVIKKKIAKIRDLFISWGMFFLLSAVIHLALFYYFYNYAKPITKHLTITHDPHYFKINTTSTTPPSYPKEKKQPKKQSATEDRKDLTSKKQNKTAKNILNQPKEKKQPKKQSATEDRKDLTSKKQNKTAKKTVSKTSDEIPLIKKHRTLPKPEYPYFAKQRGMEGRVLVRVYFSKNGKVTAVNIQKSSGYNSLDNEAKKSMQGWLWGSDAPPPIVDVPIIFKLN